MRAPIVIYKSCFHKYCKFLTLSELICDLITLLPKQAFASCLKEALADYYSELFIAQTSFSRGVAIYQTRALNIRTVQAIT